MLLNLSEKCMLFSDGLGGVSTPENVLIKIKEESRG
jgi:hypothetical protein